MVKINFSKHFTLDEVTESNTARELELDNTLPSIYYMNAINVANMILEPIRKHFGKPFSPLSWYRGESLNKAVGGSKNSDHMTASAVDLRIPGVPLMELAEYIKKELDFDQIILELLGSPGWVHVSYRKDGNRRQVLTKVPSGYVSGLKDSKVSA